MNGRDTLNDPLCVQKTLKEVNLVRIFFEKIYLMLKQKFYAIHLTFKLEIPQLTFHRRIIVF